MKKLLQTSFLVTTLAIALLCAFSMADDEGFVAAKQEIMLRKIGHELLLQSGDSLSRVLPVKQLSDNEFQITFENELSFNPDSLVVVIKRSLATHQLHQAYVVNVLNCEKKEVIFGYAILGNVKDDIIACKGRIQPKNCYSINIKFKNNGINNIKRDYLLGGIPLLAIAGFLITKSINSRKRRINTTAIKLGDTFYNEADRTIQIGQKRIELTFKENKLFSIFANSPNTVVERSRLQKEIWEDEGVIVGRSLDVFISRLRKKLESDPSLQIVNIHNKGYKLAVN